MHVDPIQVVMHHECSCVFSVQSFPPLRRKCTKGDVDTLYVTHVARHMYMLTVRYSSPSRNNIVVDQREFPLSSASRTDPLPYYKLAGGRGRHLDKLASFDAHREQGKRVFSNFARKTPSPSLN